MRAASRRRRAPRGARRPLRRARLAAALVALLSLTRPGASTRAAAPSPPHLQATAAELLDEHSGRVLYALNADTPVQPASLAKIMTFYLALDAMARGQATPDTMVPVSVAVWRYSLDNDLSRMFLLPNVPVPLKDLLIGMMVPSGDDAALAVAQFLGGGAEAPFVQQMNAEARRLGLAHTRFRNSHGLGAPGQFTTAHDVALLSLDLWRRFPNFRQYTNLEYFTWDKIRQRNWNRLVGVDPRVFGLKSGHISTSGYHLVATAAQGDTNLIAVVLGTPSLQASADEDEALLQWGFAHFHDVRVNWRAALRPGARVWKGRTETLPLAVSAGRWVTLPEPAGTEPSLRVTVELRLPIVAPVARGQVVGRAEVRSGGRVVEAVPVVAAAAVPRGSLPHVLWDDLRLLLGGLVARLHP